MGLVLKNYRPSYELGRFHSIGKEEYRHKLSFEYWSPEFSRPGKSEARGEQVLVGQLIR